MNLAPGGLDIAQLKRGILENQRVFLGRALTLVESQLPAHRELAQQLLRELAAQAEEMRSSHRIGITGPPGAGKSTLIETLGLLWTDCGEKVGVLAIDPSSSSSGGSVLGDKTRMEKLGQREGAFLRPSPTGGTLGGVAQRTREAILILEAAGYQRIVVETVGVGQSETAVSHLVDTVLLVSLPGAGDEVQGIKRGLMETADIVFVNKAEGERAALAQASANQISHALRMLSSRTPGWRPAVLAGSAHTGEGMERLCQFMEQHRQHLQGGLTRVRQEQALYWFRREVEDSLLRRFFQRADVKSRLVELEQGISRGQLSPDAAALALLKLSE